MNKKRIWKVATVIVVSVLALSIAPEVRFLALLIEAIGLDVFLFVFEVQIVALVAVTYQSYIKPALLWLNGVLERIDGFYFMPTRAMVRSCPPILLHAIPFLVSFHLIVLVGVTAYA